jgi:dTMP kinase
MACRWRISAPRIAEESIMFFSFDGIDGTGKTTQMQLFCDMLRDRGLDVVTCRDPGSTPLGERIRQLLLDTEEAPPIGRRTEMFLYMAARAQLVDEVIRPALEANQTVVCDRYVIANIVYQGYAGGLDPAEIRAVGQVATNGLVPDCVFVLDMPPAAAQQRLNRPLDRMENQGTEYKRKLRGQSGARHRCRPAGRRRADRDSTYRPRTTQYGRCGKLSSLYALATDLLSSRARNHCMTSNE